MKNSMSFIDSSRNAPLQHNISGLKKKVAQLSSDLSSGKTSNLNAATRGDYTRLAAINHQRQMNAVYLNNSKKISQDLSHLQSILQKIAEPAKSLSLRFIDVQNTSGDAVLNRAASEANALLDQTINDLNSSIAGRNLLSGSATDRAAVSGSDEILAALTLHVSGLTTADEISSAADDWFMTSGSGFEQFAYLGEATETTSLPIDERPRIYAPDISALSPEIRKFLAQLSKASLIHSVNIDNFEKSAMIRSAGYGLLNAESGMLKVSESLGVVEERVDQNRVQLGFEIAAIESAHLDLVEIDQFKTATELQSILTQIETVYTLTARSANLSLVGYLR